jgi:hypothetical protein
MSDKKAAFFITVCSHTWQNSSFHNTNIIKTRAYKKHQNTVSVATTGNKILANICGTVSFIFHDLTGLHSASNCVN